jgi:hypothetical protein
MHPKPDDGGFSRMSQEFSTAVGSATAASKLSTDPIRLHPIIDLPPHYAAAIGQIAAKWTWLENQLGVLIREGFGLDKKEGRVLVGTTKLNVKVTILRIMALKWVPEAQFRNELRKFAKDCLDQTDPRNDHVHGLWVHPLGEPDNIGLQVMESGEQRHSPHFEPVPIANLVKVVDDLKALQSRAQFLTEKIKGRIPKSALPNGG